MNGTNSRNINSTSMSSGTAADPDEARSFDWSEYDIDTFENAPTTWLTQALRDRLEHLLLSVKEIDLDADFNDASVLDGLNCHFWAVYETAPEIMELQDILCRRAEARS